MIPADEYWSLMEKRIYLSFGKRILDLAVTVPAVIVLSPLLACVTFLVRIRLGSPVLFKQIRPGLHEKPFNIYKFRTMTNERNQDGKLLSDAQRITRLGAFLRKTSLDELPELFNVLNGDMSLVGPRPLLMQYLPYYTRRERLRHTVRPGLTGLAQVSGRNYLKWDERLETDVQYVEHASLVLDAKIICQTFIQVLKSKDVAVVPGTVGSLLNHYRKHWNVKDRQDSM
jgi:lipopolysaccharide/colanic/teichoic acid biosynthesis glycosyltransferase